MLSSGQVKHVSSLRAKKFREKSGRFIAEGEKLVDSLISAHFNIDSIYASPSWVRDNSLLLKNQGIPVFETLPGEMERISNLSTPSPVLAVVVVPETPLFDYDLYFRDFPSGNCLCLALDNIRDPGNLGTILRIADWFGITTVFCSEQTVELYNPKVVQATMGSIARVKAIYCDLVKTLSLLSQTIPVYGAFLEGENLFEQDLPPSAVILIGNESHGISPELEPLITRKLVIPSSGPSEPGKAESLNASVATAILCAEFRRSSYRQ